jgi:hypothetical protein
MRRLALILILLVGLFAFVTAAAAKKPTKTPLPASDFTISGSCSFDVGVHILVNKEQAITFSDGRFTVNGALKLQLMNLSNQKSIKVNAPGPGHYTPASDGSLTLKATGPWVFFWPAGALGPGTPGALLHTTGRAIAHISPSGVIDSFTHDQGTTTDLCAVLSG